MATLTLNDKLMKGGHPTFRGLRAEVHRNWCDAPGVPESFGIAMRQFCERFGLKLTLHWDGWGHYWTLMNEERTFDFEAGEWRVQPVHFFDLVTDGGMPYALEDQRIWDDIARNYMGEKPDEKVRAMLERNERDRVELEKQHEELRQEVLEDGEPVIKAAYDSVKSGQSIEGALGHGKIHSFGANNAAKSRRAQRAAQKVSKRMLDKRSGSGSKE